MVYLLQSKRVMTKPPRSLTLADFVTIDSLGLDGITAGLGQVYKRSHITIDAEGFGVLKLGPPQHTMRDMRAREAAIGLLGASKEEADMVALGIAKSIYKTGQPWEITPPRGG